MSSKELGEAPGESGSIRRRRLAAIAVLKPPEEAREAALSA